MRASRMPRYFFSEDETGDRLDPTDEGVEFDTFHDVCHEADRALREMAVDALQDRLWISVFDENKAMVYRARLDVVQDRGQPC